MSEIKITPLARRLAEENGIDWRQLSGTGPDGTLVERDILAFLAKVMAGEVSLPPVPEEATPPPETIPDIAQAQALLQKEGVQLGDLMPTPSMTPPSTSVTPSALEMDDLDFDIDLDLDEPVLSAPASAPPVVTEPQPLNWDSEPAPLSWEPAEPFKPPVASETQPPHPEMASIPPLPEDVDFEPKLPRPTPTLSLEPEPELPASPIVQSSKLVWETQEVLPSPAMPQPSPLQPGIVSSSQPGAALEPEPKFLFEEPALPEASSPPTAPVGKLLDQPVAESPVEPEPGLPPAEALPEISPTAPTGQPAPEAELPQFAEMTEPRPQLEPTPVIVAPIAEPATPKMVRVQAWQRSVEIGPASDAATALSEAWHRNVGIYPLLYRAVDRALADIQNSLKATKGVIEGEELHSYRVTPAQSLRGALDSFEMASDPSEGLVVLSLLDSPFDQVLFPGIPALTLGRAAGRQALLSLSADMDAREAGALLERIAYYLERPILLA